MIWTEAGLLGAMAGEESDSEDDELETHMVLAELGEMDLDEEEAMEVYQATGQKTWAQNKHLKQLARTDRQSADRRAQGLDPPPPPRRGTSREERRMKGTQRPRLSIEQLKKISKCANCGQKGHWRAECTNPYKPRADGKGGAGGKPSSGKNSSHAPGVPNFYTYVSPSRTGSEVLEGLVFWVDAWEFLTTVRARRHDPDASCAGDPRLLERQVRVCAP